MHPAMMGDLALALSRTPRQAQQTWCGAWLNVLQWLTHAGGQASAAIATYLADVRQAVRSALADGTVPALSTQLAPQLVMDAWDSALRARWDAAASQPGNLVGQYVAFAALRETVHWEEDGFPKNMPLYVRHTARFANLEHARALMQLRCGSTPLATSAANREATPFCQYCPPGPDAPPNLEDPAHFLLHCPAYASIRSSARYAQLFAQPAHSGKGPSPSTIRVSLVDPRVARGKK